MSLPPSSSESAAFDQLHPAVRHWIWSRGWTELRDIQEAAAGPILEGKADVIIAAATASGKTEAAFLPICSRLASAPAGSIQALYIGPLKALINDQFQRLDDLCEHLEIPVHRWHGDVASNRKQQLLSRPAGVLLITPESLEALFVVHGSKLSRLFEHLGHIVLDELHSFLGSERGRQLQSLLHRLELALRRRIPRVGLSATLGDLRLAAEFLRPGRAEAVRLIVSTEGSQELKLQIRGYRRTPPRLSPKDAELAEAAGLPVEVEGLLTGDALQISQHLFRTLRGTNNLVFANSRQRVEIQADLLRRLCERDSLPNEFWPHHGSLAKDLREEAEAALKDPTRPATVVCTSTLEMGIDIGSVQSVAQLGAPPSVASLRQRLGRSGRRGEPAILRIYIAEESITQQTAPQDALRAELVQSIAMVQLLLEKWYEPPLSGAFHYSTLIHQVLSLIAQHGGVRAAEAWEALCKAGPFSSVDSKRFARLLRGLGKAELITQSPDGTLLLGPKGEPIVGHYSFYAVFTTPEEFRLISGGKVLGSLPIEHPVLEGSFLIFAGRRWRVLSVDAARKVIDLAPAAGGRPPAFGGSGGQVHDRVRQEMFRIYTGTEVPVFLDAQARDLLAEGRENFQRYGLADSACIAVGREVLLFCWRGDRVMNTLMVRLQLRGFKVALDGIALSVLDTTPEDLVEALHELESQPPPEPSDLIDTVPNQRSEKYDWFLDDVLCSEDYAARHLDLDGTTQTLPQLDP